jgi:urease accessory protein
MWRWKCSPDHLKLEPDHVLADMLRQRHLIVTETQSAFEPEGGAYAASGAMSTRMAFTWPRARALARTHRAQPGQFRMASGHGRLPTAPAPSAPAAAGDGARKGF